MIEEHHTSKARILPYLLKELSNRGWRLGERVTEDAPFVVLERLVQACCQGRGENKPQDHLASRSLVQPLPDWLLEVFFEEYEKSTEPSVTKLIASYLKHSEVCHDIQDNIVFWLDYDTCSACDREDLHNVLKTRRHEIRDNNFYKFLAQQEYVFKQDNVMLGRNSSSEKLSLKERLQFLGTFSCENFATVAIRDAVHESLCGKYKTNAIPDTFLDFFESVSQKHFFARVVVVCGYFTLFFSVQDHLVGLRRTTIDSKQLAALEQGTEERVIDFFRECFVNGVSLFAPSATHYRYDNIRRQKFLRQIALRFWQHKLRDELLRREKLRPRERASNWKIDQGNASLRSLDYHSGVVFSRIVPGSSGSLDFLEPRNKGCFCVTCRISSIKDPHVILTVTNHDLEQCRTVPGDMCVFRFPIKTSTREVKYYACQCEILHLKQISGSETALIAVPSGSVITLERRYPRVNADSLSIDRVSGWIGLVDYPSNLSELEAVGPAHFNHPDPSNSLILKDISAGGAKLEIRNDRLRKTIQEGTDLIGLLQMHMIPKSQGIQQILLAFRFRSLRRDTLGFYCGLQFQAEADSSNSGKFQWRDVSEQGCQELNMLIFSALLKQRRAD